MPPWGVPHPAPFDAPGPRSEAGTDAGPGSDSARLTDAVVDLGRRSGLSAVGVSGIEVFADTRRALDERRRRGLAAGMQFTYRNPERSTDPSRILPGGQAIVVGALAYPGDVASPGDLASSGPGPTGPDPGRRSTSGGESGGGGVDRPRPSGRVARYMWRDHYGALRDALGVLADHLRSLGWRATVVCDDNALVDRAAAHRAGLGWYGKNSLFFLDGLGSWFLLGSVVTDAPLCPAPSPPQAHGRGCGSCTRCQNACPTGALAESGVVDARRCLAWLLQAPGSFPVELRHALGDRIYGCDECQRVCPVNRIAERRRPAPVETAGDVRVDLLELLTASDEELLAGYGRWYIPRRDPRYLRRNALVVLGNVGDGGDAGTATALRRWLAADDPMLVEHARWAACSLGRADLVDPTR